MTADLLSQAVGEEELRMTLWADQPYTTTPGGGEKGLWTETRKVVSEWRDM